MSWQALCCSVGIGDAGQATILLLYYLCQHMQITLKVKSGIIFQHQRADNLQLLILNLIINRSKTGIQWDPKHKNMFYRSTIQFSKRGRHEHMAPETRSSLWALVGAAQD